LHFVAFAFFFKAVTVNATEILRPLSGFTRVVHLLCHCAETIFSEQFEYIRRYIIVSCRFVILHLRSSYFYYTTQNMAVFLVCTYFLFRPGLLGFLV
jgi:hypothetical protein